MLFEGRSTRLQYRHVQQPVPAISETRGVGAPILSAASTIDISANRCTSLQLLTLLNPPDVTAADFESGAMQNGGGAHSRRH